MNQATKPYFHFDGDCRQAMDFYKELFGGELYIMTVEESPMKDQLPSDIHHEILHASLTNGEFCIQASDMCGMGELKRGNAVETNLNCASEEEINHLFKQLSDGGEVLMDLQEQFWGSLFGMVIDRFGVRWMLSFDKEQ